MDRVLVTLRAHGDLTRLDLEDGLLRGALPALLDIESGLIGIDVDLRAEDQTPLGDDGTGPSAVLTFSGTADLPSVDEISAMVVEVAVVVDAYRVHSTEFGQIDDEWVGHATPGAKLVHFLHRANSASVDDVDAALDELTKGLSNAIRHRVHEELVPSRPFDAIVTTRFPTLADLDAAVAEGPSSFAAFDEATSDRVLVFEHRFRADPNHWRADDPNSA